SRLKQEIRETVYYFRCFGYSLLLISLLLFSYILFFYLMVLLRQCHGITVGQSFFLRLLRKVTMFNILTPSFVGFIPLLFPFSIHFPHPFFEGVRVKFFMFNDKQPISIYYLFYEALICLDSICNPLGLILRLIVGRIT